GHTLGSANVYQLRRHDVEAPAREGDGARTSSSGNGTSGTASGGDGTSGTASGGDGTSGTASGGDGVSATRKQTVTAPARKRASRTSSSEKFSARAPFRPALTHEQLQERVEDGMVVRRTQLTESFTLE